MNLKKITFPKKEIPSLKRRLNKCKKIFTLRVSKEKGKYKQGDLVETAWGAVLRVANVKTICSVEDYRYFNELTSAQINQVSKYELIDILELNDLNLQRFTYTDEKNKEHTIKVKPVSIFSTGLMFRKNSPPLLFDFKRLQHFAIHSLFCRPFRAIWLDEKRKTKKVIDVKSWKFNLRGEGRYLLEIQY